MILEFMVYSLVVSLLVAMAAWLAEKALGWFGVARRAAWVAGVALALAWPPLAMMMPVPVDNPVLAPTVVGEPAVEFVASRVPDVAQFSGTRVGAWTLDDAAALIWILASAGTLAYYFTSSWRLARRVRRWRRQCVVFQEVTVAPDIGPAAFGWRQPRVIFPSWLIHAPPRVQQMALIHEAQHLAARDPQVLAASTVLCALLPWNPALLWMLRRLRFAMEVDCDARVLRGGADARDYGMALLYVSERQIGASAAAIALIERTSQLERRIDIMLSSPRKLSARHGTFPRLGSLLHRRGR
jgi:bla regulator protein BlaR1